MKHLSILDSAKKLVIVLAGFILLSTPAIAVADSSTDSYYGTGNYSDCTDGQDCSTTTASPASTSGSSAASSKSNASSTTSSTSSSPASTTSPSTSSTSQPSSQTDNGTIYSKTTPAKAPAAAVSTVSFYQRHKLDLYISLLSIAILMFIFLLWRRRRRKTDQTPPNNLYQPSNNLS